MFIRPLLVGGCALFISAQPTLADTSTDSTLNCAATFADTNINASHHFDYPENIASDSVPSTVAAAIGALTTVQILRFLGSEGEPSLKTMFTPGFLLTVPTDVILTVGTHMIAIGPIPFLRKLLAGKTFGPRYEAITRTVANAALGTGVILSTWAATGIDLSSTHVSAAAGLCAAVYPVLMVTKKLLFHWLPSWRDARRVARLKELDPHGSQQIEEQALDAARKAGIKERQAKAMLLGYFESLVVGKAYEHSIAMSSELMSYDNIARAVERLLNTQAALSSRELMTLRRELVNLLLDVLQHDQDRELNAQILGLLRLEANHSDTFTLAIHQELRARSALYWRELLAASIADQAISVGIAGGIFLYGVNQWAVTGIVPWFVFW